MANFGPNHAQVAEFLKQRRAYPIGANVGEATDPDAIAVIPVGFDFLVANASTPEAPWDGNLARAEQLLLEATRESGRWHLEPELLSSVFRPNPPIPSPYLDDLLVRLDDEYSAKGSSYVRGTLTYPHEIFYDFVDRIVLGAATEHALSDYLPAATFFRSIVDWLAKGRLPYGWQGKWPSGTIILW